MCVGGMEMDGMIPFLLLAFSLSYYSCLVCIYPSLLCIPRFYFTFVVIVV